MNNLFIIEHPLLQAKLTVLRDKRTKRQEFRQTLSEIAMLMTYDITRNIPVSHVKVETPLEETTGTVLNKDVTLVPILRAGLGMIDGILELLPDARVGHVGVYRDKKTLLPVEYYLKLPENVKETFVILVDPMLATGGSALAAIEILRQKGIKELNFLCLVAAPEGVRAVHEKFPDVKIFTAALDRQLNEHGYILPGLGDAGDRLYGTE
ncbi:uracil phosphoribosyltransferase [Caldithrix abyssi]|uniref:Uracil phosphoribosyltransferase n=1 Tax=Caldithrix abyssi DSM 13497 TaxID=880073 RepID=H1XXY6_CALAY|nr:uracil phosphoribosyltransferase [Caldithrix abyssi]APF20638.1 upp uracil phosphoribosyltransferase [Caldithrix abyssi DSM 13497]EHO40861.1 uracil phosphoribosyltransferase [Caldithrix abyssi DSM 13497]